MTEPRAEQATVVVHYAGTVTEALVIRGLLESAGMQSPAPTSTDPFPLRETPQGTHGVEIMVLESQAGDARAIIADYLGSRSDTPSPESDESAEGPAGE